MILFKVELQYLTLSQLLPMGLFTCRLSLFTLSIIMYLFVVQCQWASLEKHPASVIFVFNEIGEFVFRIKTE